MGRPICDLANACEPAGPYFNGHSKTGPNIGTNDEPTYIDVTSGKTYWINVKYSSTMAQCHFAAYDPDNNYAQVGTTLQVVSVYNSATDE